MPGPFKKRPPRYRVVNPSPRNTGTKERPQFGPSGQRKGTHEKVYTQADVDAYQKATGEKDDKKKTRHKRARAYKR